MAKQTYHIGLCKQGDTVIVQVADSVDQLSCELWKYLGERETTAAAIKANAASGLKYINQVEGTAFTRLKVERIGCNDYSAGHTSTLPQEIAEANAAR
jgi:hypothetical protein